MYKRQVSPSGADVTMVGRCWGAPAEVGDEAMGIWTASGESALGIGPSGGASSMVCFDEDRMADAEPAVR